MSKDAKPTVEERLQTVEAHLGIGVEHCEIKLPACRGISEMHKTIDQIRDLAKKHMPGLVSTTINCMIQPDNSYVSVINLAFKK
jgi:hypothetical protein